MPFPLRNSQITENSDLGELGRRTRGQELATCNLVRDSGVLVVNDADKKMVNNNTKKRVK